MTKGRGPYAALFDGGRGLRVQAADVPGLDTAWWVDGRIFEESIFDYGFRRNTIPQNELMKSTAGLPVRQWGEDLPGHMWIDNTNRYPWTGVDGLKMNLYHVDRVAGDFPLLPAGEVPYLEDPDDPEVDRAAGRFLREFDYQEIQNDAENPSEWYRLPTLNEQGGTQLREPLALVVPEVRGAIALELVDQSLWDPFDLRQGDRYRVRTNNDEILEGDAADEWRFLQPRGVYRLTLRPRRWRYFVTCYVIYVHISFVELYYVREVFTQAWYDIPPCYPLRHNIIDADVIGGDPAVFWAFEHSQAAADLTDQIFDAQYWTLSEAHIFHHVELVQMWISKAPPRKHEYVLGIERLDVSGTEPSRVWLEHTRDLSSEYPQQQIAFFQEVPWYILPPGA
jgi:hypothetical protein